MRGSSAPGRAKTPKHSRKCSARPTSSGLRAVCTWKACFLSTVEPLVVAVAETNDRVAMLQGGHDEMQSFR